MEKTNCFEKVWIVAAGSRGDIQPYVALGAVLVKRGYNVTFLTYHKYAEFVETFGMKGVSLGKDYESSILENANIKRGMAEGDTLRTFKGIAKLNEQNAPTLFRSILSEIKDHGVPHLCLAMPFSQYVAWYLWVHHQVPYLHLTTFALAYNPDHMLIGLPKLPFHLTYYILFHLVVGGAYDMFHTYENYMNAQVLDNFTKSKYIEYYKNPTLPMVAMFSPELASVIYPPDVVSSSMWRFVGSVVIPSQDQVNNLDYFGGQKVSQDINSFLSEKYNKPVYLGWGSMICISASHMVELCVRAVHHAGVRAIVLGGAAGLTLDLIDIEENIMEYAKTNILFVDHAPHEWLFPRVAATVHHGGAGTTTAALRGGVPTIITPVFGDQYDFSYAINEMGVGVGFTKQFHKINWKELGDALVTVTTNPGMAQRAAELGIKLQKEDGANVAVDEMERYWADYCENGKFDKYAPCLRAEEVEKSRKASSLRKAVVVAAVAASTVCFVIPALKKRR